MGREIGAVRDLDVLKIALSKQSRRIDPELQRALRPLHRQIVERRRVALAAMIEVLDSSRYRELLSLLRGLVQTRARLESASPIGEIAPDIVRPAWRALVRAHRRLENDESAEHYHRLRVRAKRLRYTLESLQTLGGKRVRRTIEQLVDLQDLLGAHQDAVSQGAWMRGYASAADSPPIPPLTLLAIGAVTQTLARRERRSRRRVPAAWRRIAARGLQRKVLAELHYPGQRPRPVRLLRTGS
jgi:CHAD domain-containing protein